LIFATLAQSIIVFFACKLIRQDRLTSINFAMAMNARGDPSIVLSTVAYSAGIINQDFFWDSSYVSPCDLMAGGFMASFYIK
jgi:Kef-type K+ transport system membrane component KefB